MGIQFKGMPRTRPNDPRRILSGGLKFVTECDTYCGFGDTRQESFAAWKEARDQAMKEQSVEAEEVQNVQRIEREESIWLKILDLRSMTAIQWLVEDNIVLLSKLSTIVALKKIRETNILDEVYAICHEQLGEHDRAKELRDFMAKKAAEPKDPELFDLEDDMPDWLKLENHPRVTGADWDRAANYDDPFYQGGKQSNKPSGSVQRYGEKLICTSVRMRYALVRTEGRKTIELCYFDNVDSKLDDEVFIIAAIEARKRGWRRGVLQLDQFMGETIELLNRSEFYTQYATGRPGIYIRSI
jgi:hypothetical protein